MHTAMMTALFTIGTVMVSTETAALRGCPKRQVWASLRSISPVLAMYIQSGFDGFAQCFVVFAQPALQVQPAQGPFHDPPAGQHLEGGLLGRTAY